MSTADRIEVSFGPYKATVQLPADTSETEARRIGAEVMAIFERRCGL